MDNHPLRIIRVPTPIERRLTEEQCRFCRDYGYLLVPQALSAHHIDLLISAIDKLHKERYASSQDEPSAIGFDAKFIVNEHDIFRDLIDYEPIFHLILDLLGPCIQLCISQALIRPARNPFKGFMHTDGGQAIQGVHLRQSSIPLQIKVQYFLTDLLRPDSGNFIFVKGSHMLPFPVYDRTRVQKFTQAEQLIVRAGDAVLFVNSLWHGVTENKSDQDRKSVIYGYNQMFMRPYDYHQASPELLGRCTPRQRRLLGDVGTALPQAHYYAPRDQIVLMEALRTEA